MFKLTLLACLLAPLICRARAGEFKSSANGDSFYLEQDLEVTWEYALHVCTSRNMSLLTPDTDQKQQAISELFSYLYNNHVWTSGLENRTMEFIWITTGESLNYSNWELDEPYRDGNETDPQCIAMHEDEWGSYRCDTLMNFICEENPIFKYEDLELDALKSNQSETNNQLDDSMAPLSNHTQELNDSRKKLECDRHIITELDILWKSNEKQRDDLLEAKQKEISDLKNKNNQYLDQLSLAKAQLELKSKEIEMVKELYDIKLQMEALKVCCNASQKLDKSK